MTTYEEAISELERDCAERRKNLGELEPLFKIASEIGENYEDLNPTVGWTGRRVDLWLSLSKKNKGKDAITIINKVIKSRKLDLLEPIKNVKTSGYICCSFHLPEDRSLKLDVNIYYIGSATCEMIDTGETRKVYEYVCKDKALK